MFHHSAAQVGGSLVGTAPVASGVGAGLRERISDSKLSPIVRLEATSGDAWIAWDGAAGHVGLDRLFIPTGHNLASVSGTVELRSKASAFAGPLEGTLRHSWTPTAGLQDRTFTAITDRYLALVVKAVTGRPELGECFVSQIRTPARGPLAPWIDTPTPNLLRTETRERDLFFRALGPPLREIVWQFERVELTSGDLTLFRELASDARLGIVYVDPPTNDGAAPDPALAFWAEVAVEQTSGRPSGTGLTYSARVTLLEAL
jgi:hypothetical protein